MGFFLQMINVKIIIYGLTMFSAYILPYEARVPMLFAFAVYLMILGALGNLIWAIAGNMLKCCYTRHYKSHEYSHGPASGMVLAENRGCVVTT